MTKTTTTSTQHTAHSTLNIKPNKIILIMMLMGFSFLMNHAKAQGLSATLQPSEYAQFNISCNGASDGSITVSVSGGTAPYTYLWNNGSTTQNRTNLTAGNYAVTITDFVHTSITKTIVLKEPKAIIVALNSPEYEGNVNISKYGHNDGTIDITVTGGNPPYRYQWSNGSVEARQSNLIAGTYSVTITDDNNCTKAASITLTEPGTMQISNIVKSVFGNYNVSCADAENGSITLTISGGVAPYEFDWSNGAMTKDILNVGAAEYHVRVTDRNGTEVSATIILTAPANVATTLTPSVYTAPYNISCVGCSDGSISSNTSGGIAPYTYSWNTGQTTANINNVSGGVYVLTVTDANGCSSIQAQQLVSPPQDGWNKYGNTATNPATQFIGTTDNTDMVIKTNNTEAIHIKNDGKIGIGTSNPASKLTIYDAQHASFRLSQLNRDSLVSFDVSFLSADSTADGIFKKGTIVMGAASATPVSGSTMGTNAAFRMVINNNVASNPPPPLSPCTLLHEVGQENNPDRVGLAFKSKNDFGWYGPACPQGSSTLQMYLDAFGNLNVKGGLGIGGSMDIGKNLKVRGDATFLGNVFFKGTIDNMDVAKCSNTDYAATISNCGGEGKGLLVKGGGGVNAATDYAIFEVEDYAGNPILRVDGKNNATYAKDMWVTVNNFPDYVFNKDYELMNLPQLENYINTNHHLPNMPTAAEAETKGISIGNLQKQLTEKVEQLTLYQIEMNKQLELLKQQNELLKSEIAQLKK